MSLPMMASMLIQALYNIVDSMFVAQISEEAITALSLAFPVQNLMIGVATGTGVGMNALLSRSLGEKDTKRVNQAATNGVALAFLSSILFVLFGIFGSKIFFAVQTDNADIIMYGTQYISICTIGSVFLYISIIFERLMQATAAALLLVAPTVTKAQYTPTAENLKSRQEFADSKFGIFIHWGIYSMFAQGEWYLQNYPIDKAEYAKAAEQFTLLDGYTNSIDRAKESTYFYGKQLMEQDLLIREPIDQVVMHYAKCAAEAGLAGVVA